MSQAVQPLSAVARSRAAMARVQSKPLYYWGLANVFGLFVIVMGHPFLPEQHVFRLHFISMAVWLLFAWGTNVAPLRVPVPIGIVLMLALWIYVCTILAQGSLFRFVSVLDNGLYEIPWLVLNFLQGAALAFFAPQARSVVAKIVVVLALASSVMAILQFLGIGVAIRLGGLFNVREIGAGIDVEGVAVRAFGIFRIGQGVILSTIAAMILVMPLLWRKVPWWHIALAGLIITGGLLGQVRSFMPMLGLAYLIMTGLMLYRYGTSRWLAGLLAVAMILPVAFAVPRMGYVMEMFQPRGDRGTTLTYRQEHLWPQITLILSERPWTGIGYEPQLYGAGGPATRRTSGLIVDGGYHMILGMGGYPALALLILFLASAIVVAIRAAREARDDWGRLPLIAGILLFVLTLPLLTVFGPVGYAQHFSGITYLVAGLCMATGPALASEASRQNLLAFAGRARRRVAALRLAPAQRPRPGG
jgi:hypothetical protein